MDISKGPSMAPKKKSGIMETASTRIMLDNMIPEEMKKAVKTIRGKRGDSIKIEASGNITLESLEAICKTGIDLVSVGAVTHSAPAIDFSLEFE